MNCGATFETLAKRTPNTTRPNIALTFSAVIAPPGDPACQDNLLPRVLTAQRAGLVGPDH